MLLCCRRERQSGAENSPGFRCSPLAGGRVGVAGTYLRHHPASATCLLESWTIPKTIPVHVYIYVSTCVTWYPRWHIFTRTSIVRFYVFTVFTFLPYSTRVRKDVRNGFRGCFSPRSSSTCSGSAAFCSVIPHPASPLTSYKRIPRYTG